MNNRGRGRALRAALMAAVALMAATEALAQGAVQRFNIPAQSLSGALNAFGRQSGLQITLAASASQGVNAKAVSGALTVEEALGRLLAGTGLSWRIVNGTAVIGSAPAGGAQSGAAGEGLQLAPIVVQGVFGAEGDIGERVIGREELERINPSSLADVFREEPGVQVGSSLPASQKLYVHGVEETGLAVSIDGARQNNKVFHHNATTLVDPAILKAVDVDAGIAPADAGPGALAGAVNYETRDATDLLEPGRSFGGLATATYNFNSKTVITGLSAFGKQEGFEYLGYFTFGRGGEFHSGTGAEVPGTRTDLLSGLGKLAYETPEGHRFELSHDRLLDDAQRPYRANAGFINTGRPWEPVLRDYRLNRQNTVFTYSDATPEGWWDPTVMLAYGATNVRLPLFGPTGYTNHAEGETASLNGKIQNRFTFDLGTVTAGLDFYRDRAELDVPGESGTEKASNLGLYAQARLEPWERTRLSFGGRADRQWFTGVEGSDFSNGGLSGNLSAEYDLTGWLTAKAGAARVWGGVPLAENFIINPLWTYGAKGPDAVHATNFLIGLTAHHEGFTAEASLFRTLIDDARGAAYRPPATGALVTRDLESRGFELGLGYQWASGYVKGRYVHIDVDVNGLPATSDTGNYLATPVGDIFSLSAAHTFVDHGVTIGGDIEIAPEYDHVAPTMAPYKAYEVVNLFAEWKPESSPRLTLRGEVRNLFDETYSSRATYGQEFGNVTPLYEPGRTFLLTVKATF